MIFSNPWYLFGLLLCATPIIIHLWFQRKLKRVPFSSLDFLKKTEAHRFGWLRLRDILILIFRCLIIAFLFLGLARPVIPGRFFFTKRLASLVVIPDNSFSMGYSDNFSKAREILLRIIDRYSPRSEFYVLPICPLKNDRMISWTTKSKAKEQLNDLSITYQKGSLKSILDMISIPDHQYDLEYVYIGDCQENNFVGFEDIIPAGSAFYAIRIPAGNNVTIDNIELTDPISIPNDYYQLSAKIVNYGNHDWDGKIEIKSGAYRSENEINIVARSDHKYELSLPVRSNQGSVSIYDDSLPIDNIRYFSKKIPYQLKLLIINSNSYIKAGLHNREMDRAPFSVDYLPGLGNHDLRKYDIIILNGIAEINVGEKLRLKNFLADSTKGLLCFLDERIGDNLSELIKPCSVETYTAPQGYVTLDWIDTKHRVMSVFRLSNALRNIKFYRFQKLNNKGKVIARLSNNYPLITQIDNMMVVATEFDPKNSDIVYKTAFVPLLYRLIVSAGLKERSREFNLGDKSNRFFTGPSGLKIPKGNEFLIPGFYHDRGESIAVNIDPSESDLKPLGAEQAKALNVIMIDHQSFFGGTELSNLFLLLALISLLFEVVLLLIK